ncbi:MAG: hypothetical protein ABL949_08250 [Fimbriimonadaceae bacterium]
MNKKTIIWGAGALALLTFIAFGMGLFGAPSDQELIQKALDNAVKAGQEGRPGSVIEFLANDFEINGEKYRMGQIAEQIKKLKPKAEFANRVPSVSGDSATLVSNIKLSVSLPPVNVDVDEVTVEFEKRSARKWLIFPDKQWQLTRVTVPAESYERAAAPFSGNF